MGLTLRRYLVREILVSVGAGLGVFGFILLITRLLELVDLILARGVPATAILRVLVYIVPSFLEISIPVALLLGVIVGLGRLASDGELLAIRAAGISLWQLTQPATLVGCLAAACVLLIAGWVRPWSLARVEDTLYEIAATRASAALRPAMFNAVGEGLVIYAERIEPRANRLHGILLSDERKPGTRTTILAQSAELRGDVPARDLLLRLEQGTSVTFQPDASNHDTTVFGSLEVHLDSGSAAAHGNVSRAPRVELMYPGALYEDAVSIAPERQHSLEASLELHRRGAFAVGTLLLALLGVALGNRPARSARALGLAVSVGVAVAYQSALTVTGALARRHTLSAAAAMWAPDLVLALATAMLLARAALEASPPSLLGYLGFRPRALG